MGIDAQDPHVYFVLPRGANENLTDPPVLALALTTCVYMRRGGYEKEAAVPLGVSLCPANGPAAERTDRPQTPGR